MSQSPKAICVELGRVYRLTSVANEKENAEIIKIYFCVGHSNIRSSGVHKKCIYEYITW